MADEVPELVARVNRAMSYSRPEDVIEGVKDAVRAGIRDVDAKAHVDFTRYFNHSYNPDMVVSWKGSDAAPRPVFLRGSLGDGGIEADLEKLKSVSPILIGLQADKRKVEREVRPVVIQSQAALATDVRSVSMFRAAPGKSNSLSRIVRSNLLKEARGFLGARETARIIKVGESTEPSAVRAFRETVESLFPGGAGERLGETARLLEEIADPRTSAAVARYLQETKLSLVELSVLLPVVLSAESDAIDDAVWPALGHSLSLSALEGLSAELGELDLTPLITANAGVLQGERARLDDNANLVEEEEGDIGAIARWRMRGGLVTAEIANKAIYIASSGYWFRKPLDGVDARWEELSERLGAFEVAAVELHGLSDRLQVAGEDAQRVRANVEAIRRAIQDDFHVPSIEVRERGVPEAGTLRVEFSVGRVDRRSGTASLRALVLAASLMDRSGAVSRQALASLVGEAGAPDSGAEIPRRGSGGDPESGGDVVEGESSP